MRRLRGRMNATGNRTVAEYAALVERDPDEYERLIGSLLIKVTEFFRDPKVWDHLRDDVLPGLIEDARREGRELRVWTAGCSSGEEAYSLAITIAEVLGRRDRRSTSASSRPTSTPRRSRSPVAASTRRARSRASRRPLRSRYFTPAGTGFEVVKSLRSQMVFGEHDLSARVPFPRIDLLLCRNVLIYFTPPLQRVALETFAYSLRPDGRLVLGPSETVAALPDPYDEEHARLRIYRRLPGQQPVPQAWPKVVPTARDVGIPLDRAIRSTRRDAGAADEPAAPAEGILLGLDIGVIVVDPHYDIIRINTAARRVLGIHGTAFDQDFVHLADALPSTADPQRHRVGSQGQRPARRSTRWNRPTCPRTRRATSRRRSGPYRTAGSGVAGAVIELADVSRSRARPRRLTPERGNGSRRPPPSTSACSGPMTS